MQSLIRSKSAGVTGGRGTAGGGPGRDLLYCLGLLFMCIFIISISILKLLSIASYIARRAFRVALQLHGQ